MVNVPGSSRLKESADDTSKGGARRGSEGVPEDAMSFTPGTPEVYGDAHPKELLRAIEEDHDVLRELAHRHIISAGQFNRDVLLQLFRLAAKFESNPHRFNTPLNGKLLISAFYEPSTRTRLSFESAWHRMGGDIMSITDRATTGIAKGESYGDVAEMFNHYGDCVVLRDSNEDAVHRMARHLRIPIINAGNGTDEHPTQALADVYTILKWRSALLRGAVDPIRICIIGVPSRMRTVRSLLTLLARFSAIVSEVVVVSDQAEATAFTPGQREELSEQGLNLRLTTQLEPELPRADVVYINAIAWIDDDKEVMGARYRLDVESPLKPDAIVMHPLARGEELDTSLDHTPHNWYFAQARGAVFLRMALLTCMTERTERVMDVV
jgi:aspartate carbamoyltransferase catalytic subunit